MELGAEVHRLVPKLLRAEVTRAEHRLPLSIVKIPSFVKSISDSGTVLGFMVGRFGSKPHWGIV